MCKFITAFTNPHATCHNHEPIDPVLTFPSYSSKIRFNNIFIFKPESLQEVSYPGLITEIPYSFLSSPKHATCSIHLFVLDLITG